MGAPKKKRELVVTMKCVDPACGKERNIRPMRPEATFWPLCSCGAEMHSKRMAVR